jgi:hypothetical protein
MLLERLAVRAQPGQRRITTLAWTLLLGDAGGGNRAGSRDSARPGAWERTTGVRSATWYACRCLIYQMPLSDIALYQGRAHHHA